LTRSTTALNPPSFLTPASRCCSSPRSRPGFHSTSGTTHAAAETYGVGKRSPQARNHLRECHRHPQRT
jgi:hypothetical protein